MCRLGAVTMYAGTTMTEPMISQVFFDVLLKVIPIGIGSAISPVILEVALTLLARKDYLRKRANAYLAGAVLVVIILAKVNSAIGTGTASVKKSTSQFSSVLGIFVGSLLIGFGIKSALEKRSQKGQKPPVHGTASSARFARSFLLGSSWISRTLTLI